MTPRYYEKAEEICSQRDAGIKHGWAPCQCEAIAQALRESAAEAFEEAAKIECRHCREGERVYLKEVQWGGPDWVHDGPDGASICISDRLWSRAAALRKPAADNK